MAVLTPVLAQILHHHVVIVMENEKHAQHTVALDYTLKQVDEGEYGEVVKRCKERDATPIDSRPKPLSQPPVPVSPKATS